MCSSGHGASAVALLRSVVRQRTMEETLPNARGMLHGKSAAAHAQELPERPDLSGAQPREAGATAAPFVGEEAPGVDEADRAARARTGHREERHERPHRTAKAQNPTRAPDATREDHEAAAGIRARGG